DRGKGKACSRDKGCVAAVCSCPADDAGLRAHFPMQSQIDSLRLEAIAALGTANDTRSLEAVRVRYLGKNGAISRLSEGMREVPRQDRPRLGKLLNELR